MANPIDFTKKTLAIITGASQGIGQRIAIDLSAKLIDESIIILIARSESGLNNTKSFITNNVKVKIYPLDLSTAGKSDYEKIINENLTDVENSIIFHNAGSLGTLDKVTNLTDVSIWRSFFDLNLFSVSLLNSVFLTTMRKCSKNIFIINISSLCGSQPFKDMGMYGTGKAARNLFFKVLATEESDVVVLNYSPGPVDTEMVNTVIANVKDPEIKSMFVGLKTQNTILTAQTTITKLMGILVEGGYQSGDLRDYYDRV